MHAADGKTARKLLERELPVTRRISARISLGARHREAAHIHKGRAGVSGSVFIPLGGKYTAKGCASASKKMIDAVESNPNGYYVNVHNAKYPNGVVRGQLVAGMVHM